MTLPQLINFLRKGGSLENLLELNDLDKATEDCMVFSSLPFGLEKDLRFFDTGKTGDKIEYEVNGTVYHYLIELDWIEDMVSESEPNISDFELAKIALNYAMNDA